MKGSVVKIKSHTRFFTFPPHFSFLDSSCFVMASFLRALGCVQRAPLCRVQWKKHFQDCKKVLFLFSFESRFLNQKKGKKKKEKRKRKKSTNLMNEKSEPNHLQVGLLNNAKPLEMKERKKKRKEEKKTVMSCFVFSPQRRWCP